MANSAAPLMRVFGITDSLIPLILEDLSDSESRVRARGDDGPSIAWHLGHLLCYRCQGLQMLGQAVDNPYEARFGNDPATDGGDYPTVAELKAQWEDVSQRFLSAVSAATDDALAAPVGGGPHAEETLRDRLGFLAFHEGYHTGSIAALQKTIDKRTPAEKIVAAMQAAG